MSSETKFIPIKLDNGTEIYVKATVVSPLINESLGEAGQVIEENVAFDNQHLQEFTEAIEGIAKLVKDSVDTVKPSKASVQFGFEVGYESGKVVALMFQGEGKATLNITLEWENTSSY